MSIRQIMFDWHCQLTWGRTEPPRDSSASASVSIRTLKWRTSSLYLPQCCSSKQQNSYRVLKLFKDHVKFFNDRANYSFRLSPSFSTENATSFAWFCCCYRLEARITRRWRKLLFCITFEALCSTLAIGVNTCLLLEPLVSSLHM